MTTDAEKIRFPSAKLKKSVQVLTITTTVLMVASLIGIQFIVNDNTQDHPIWIRVIFWLAAVSVAAFIVQNVRYYIRLNEYEKQYDLREGSITFLSEHDDLTGLYRRHAAIEHLNRVPRGEIYTAIMMDIDEFKEINDIYGHDFGDRVLIDIAKKLDSYANKNNAFVARYGSDEFLMVVFGQHVKPTSHFMNEMRELIHEPLEIGLANIVPTVSMGIAFSDNKLEMKDVLIHADIADAEAKKHGRKSVIVFSDAMEKKIEAAHEIKDRIYNAITHDGLYMVYQPKIRASDKALVGFEALVRLKDSNISPAVFIPIAEENGWQREIGRITTQKVIAQLAKWREQGEEIYPVSVNYSAIQLRDNLYLDFVLKTLHQYDIPVKYFEIEITENILLDHTQEAVELISNFQKAGIRLLLDDFGTGYSSLSYLSNIPLDVIKVDKSFVDEYPPSEKKELLLKDIIHLGHDVGADIIVEGVETNEQYLHLKEMGADYIQGYVFSKPLLPEDAIHFSVNKKKVNY